MPPRLYGTLRTMAAVMPVNASFLRILLLKTPVDIYNYEKLLVVLLCKIACRVTVVSQPRNLRGLTRLLIPSFLPSYIKLHLFYMRKFLQARSRQLAAMPLAAVPVQQLPFETQTTLGLPRRRIQNHNTGSITRFQCFHYLSTNEMEAAE
jgi:hypothetical protein